MSACAALFVGVAVSVMLESGLTAGAVVLAVLALLSLFNLAGAYADRYTIGESGIRYENRILTRLGKRPRHLAWADIGRVREHRRLTRSRRRGR